MEVSEKNLAAAATAPRVSKADVERAIGEGKVTFTVLPNGRTTVAQVELFNERFSVEGSSACVSKENFNELYGQKFALDRATDKVWEALGTILAWQLSKIDAAGAAEGRINELGVPMTYVGTKVVHAVRMSRGEYNRLRGWDLPAMEDPLDAGYLVEYTDGGGPNVEGFPGYVSWTPADVFERSYTLGMEPQPKTFLDRLHLEVRETENRFIKLVAFIATDNFLKLPAADQRDLVAQKACMEELVWLLKKRIRRAG